MTNENMNGFKLGVLVLIAIAIVSLYDSIYVVDETEQVVITQFGRIVGEAQREPGLDFKVPFIQKANYFPRTCWSGTGIRGRCPQRIRHIFGWIPLPGGGSVILSFISRR